MAIHLQSNYSKYRHLHKIVLIPILTTVILLRPATRAEHCNLVDFFQLFAIHLVTSWLQQNRSSLNGSLLMQI